MPDVAALSRELDEVLTPVIGMRAAFDEAVCAELPNTAECRFVGEGPFELNWSRYRSRAFAVLPGRADTPSDGSPGRDEQWVRKRGLPSVADVDTQCQFRGMNVVLVPCS